MKTKLLLLSMVAFAQNVYAGDAGYFSRTCTSASQRTVLTLLADYSDYQKESDTYTLVMDGAPVVYSTKDPSLKVVGDDGILTLVKNGRKAITVITNTQSSVVKVKLVVYQDPREGTIAMNNATATPVEVSLTCKDYWPAP